MSEVADSTLDKADPRLICRIFNNELGIDKVALGLEGSHHDYHHEPPEDVARWLLSADLDLCPFYSKVNSTISKLVMKLYGLKPPRTRTLFEALVLAIIEQQIGLNVAITFQNRLVKRYGVPVQYKGEKDMTFFTFPTPESLSEAKLDDLRSFGLSRNKAIFLTELSKKVVSGELDLESMRSIKTNKVREVLMSIKGIGPWTADYALIRGLGRVELAPYDDLGIRDAIGLYYKNGERVTSSEAETILSEFGEYAGLAAYYLIFARMYGLAP